ncbi:hypothetical protein M1403_00530 [Patescibacteria group bacterium]|nr:hypothetical protein [Patescibacteria group bacterium]
MEAQSYTHAINNQVIEETAQKKKPKNMTLWLISGIVGLMFMVVLGLILVGVSLIVSSARNLTPTKPAPEPAVTESAPLPPKISRFASDSAVLDLQSGVGKLRSDIDTTDLFEPQLTPPNIDLNISIQSVN